MSTVKLKNLIANFEKIKEELLNNKDDVYVFDTLIEDGGFIYMLKKNQARKLRQGKINPDNERDLIWILQNGYYYIKRLFHYHKHHDRHDEGCTSLHRNIPFKYPICEMISEIKGALVEINRTISMEETAVRAQMNSPGFFPYLSSLIDSAYRTGKIGDKEYRYEKRVCDNFSSSCQILVESKEKKKGELKEKKYDRLQYVLYFMAFYTLLTALLQLIISSFEDLDSKPIVLEVISCFILSDYNIAFGIAFLSCLFLMGSNPHRRWVNSTLLVMMSILALGVTHKDIGEYIPSHLQSFSCLEEINALGYMKFFIAPVVTFSSLFIAGYFIIKNTSWPILSFQLTQKFVNSTLEKEVFFTIMRLILLMIVIGILFVYYKIILAI